MKKNGFTLLELIVGMAIAALIFLAVSSLIVLLFSSNTRTKQLDQLAQTKNDLQIELSNTIKWGQDISFTNSPAQISVDSVVYRLDSEQIYKNDVPLTSFLVRVTNMEIHNYSVNPQYVSLDITVDLEHKNISVVHDQLHFVVSQRPTEITVNFDPPQIHPSIAPPSPSPASSILPTPRLTPRPSPRSTVRPLPRPTVRPRPRPTPRPTPSPTPRPPPLP